MEIFTNVRFILLLYIGIVRVIQVNACDAFSFDSSGKVAHCHPTKKCPSASDVCHNMNVHVSYGTCCLSCERGQINPPSSRTCSSITDCPSSTMDVQYSCQKPKYKPDAMGLCCGRPLRQY
ncbi:hypothetical protein ACF0H5_011228 [Mactra antiquata]